MGQDVLERVLSAYFDGPPEAVQALDGDVDLNFLVHLADQRRVVVKIRRQPEAEDFAFVTLQQILLDHLNGRAGSVSLPALLRTLAGQPFHHDELSGCLAWVVTYIEGDLLAAIDHYDDQLLFDIGHATACIDKALIPVQCPESRRLLSWDLAQFSDLRDALSVVRDGEQRELLQASHQFHASHIAPKLGRLPRSTIHNDCGNQYNMLLKPEASGHRVVGVIDFGDAVWTERINGLGIAAAYASFGATDTIAGMARVAAGYDQVLPLSDLERYLVVGLAMTRLAMSVTHSTLRANQDDAQAYHSVSAAAAWRVLGILHGRGLERCIDEFGQVMTATIDSAGELWPDQRVVD